MKPLLKMSVLIITILLSMQGLDAQNVGSAAPDFTFKNMEGIDVKLSDHKGKVVFLCLFGYGCLFCFNDGASTETQVNGVYGSKDDFQALGFDLWIVTLT